MFQHRIYMLIRSSIYQNIYTVIYFSYLFFLKISHNEFNV